MIDIKKRVLEVLDKTHLMSLATMDDAGVWVADVIFIYDKDLNIYWLSAPEARHSQAVLKNNKVAGTITYSTKKNEPNFGIQLEGRVERLEGIQFILVAKHWAKRGHPAPDISKVATLLDGDCWYKMTPTKIELVDEENFGFERQILK